MPLSKISERPALVVSRRPALWLTLALYWATGLSMATIGVLVPAMARIQADLGVSAADLGLAISLFSLPSAVVAMGGGVVVDALGARATLLLSTGLAGLADAVIAQAGSLLALDGALVLAGLGFAGISVAAPAALMALERGAAQVRAMAFWSTYAPTGYAAGLLLAVPFLAGGHWRAAFVWHGALLASAFCALATVPMARAGRAGKAPGGIGGWRAGVALLADPALWRLGVAVAVPNGVSYGVSLVAPSYLARAHGVGLAESSGAVAVVKILAMVLGGLVTGQLLARHMAVRRLYLPLVAVGLMAQGALFLPMTPFWGATLALVVWLFAFGGMAGAAMAHLPTILRDPARAGLASGLVGQMISIASFAAPPLYFGLQAWWAYLLVAGAGLVLAGVALPGKAGLSPSDMAG